MKLSLVSWNSLNINDGNPLKSYIPVGQLANLRSNIVSVPRSDDYPFISTRQLPEHIFVIEVYIAAGQNINTNREILKKYFNVTDRQRHNLIAQDEADGNKQYYLTGYPMGVSSQGNNQPNAFNVRFQVEYAYWRLVTPTADSWDITASGDSDAISNAGNINIQPIFTITPTSTKTKGYKYRRYIPIYNNLDKSFESPIDITNGGLDVQSLINANKMQADGDDFRVWLDGGFADRWLYEMDSDSDPALCWVNLGLSPRHEGTTSATFDSDDTIMSFGQTRANLKFLQSLKVVSNRTLLIDSEAITYSGDSDVNTVTYQLSNISRGAKNTTAVSHSSLSTVRHIEHDLWILYGDSDAVAPDIDNDYKPIFDLNSTNLSWIYNTNFFDESSFRGGTWKSEVNSSRTGLSYPFTGNQNSFIDPSTEMGLALVNSADFQIANETGQLDWIISHPAYINNVLFSVKKYESDSGSWPAIVGLQYLQPNVAWFTAHNESEPTLTDTWQSSGPHNISFGNSYETIRFAIDGLLSSIVNSIAMAQFDTVTLSLDSDNIPTIVVNSENSINFFDFTLTNNTTGEYIKVQAPCPINTALTIDCEAKKAYLADGSKVNVILSSNRSEWLDLAPGANNLNYVDVGTAGIHVVISHRDRIL